MRLSKALQSIGRFSLEDPNLEAVFHMPPSTRQRGFSMVMWGLQLLVRDSCSLATLLYSPLLSSRVRFSRFSVRFYYECLTQFSIICESLWACCKETMVLGINDSTYLNLSAGCGLLHIADGCWTFFLVQAAVVVISWS